MNHAVRTRSWQNVTVTEGGEQSCALPPSYAGRFSGELTTGGDAAGAAGPLPGGDQPLEHAQ